MSELKDAYYSTLGSERVGYAIYLDTNGKEVAVSEVVEVGSKPTSKWPDLVLVGQVTKFVKQMPDDDDRKFIKQMPYDDGRRNYEQGKCCSMCGGAGFLTVKDYPRNGVYLGLMKTVPCRCRQTLV